MCHQTEKRHFSETFFDDRIINPIDRLILLLDVEILDRLDEDAETVRPCLDSITLPEIVTKLAKHDCTLTVVSARKK